MTHSESSERRVFGEGLNAPIIGEDTISSSIRTTATEREKENVHGLGGDHLDDGGISRLDELGEVFNRLTRTTVDLLEESVELAGNLISMRDVDDRERVRARGGEAVRRKERDEEKERKVSENRSRRRRVKRA